MGERCTAFSEITVLK